MTEEHKKQLANARKKRTKSSYAKVGRPTVMTEEVVRKLEEAFAIGCTDLEACSFADISKHTLYDYQAKYPEFADRKARLKEKPILKARHEVVKGLTGNPEFSLKFLERKLPEFSTKTYNESEVKQDVTFKWADE